MPVAGRSLCVRPARTNCGGAIAAAELVPESTPVTIRCQFTGARGTGDAEGSEHVRHDARIAAWKATRAREVLDRGPRGCGRRLRCRHRLATRLPLCVFASVFVRPLSSPCESCRKGPLRRTPLAMAAELRDESQEPGRPGGCEGAIWGLRQSRRPRRRAKVAAPQHFLENPKSKVDTPCVC